MWFDVLTEVRECEVREGCRTTASALWREVRYAAPDGSADKSRGGTSLEDTPSEKAQGSPIAGRRGTSRRTRG